MTGIASEPRRILKAREGNIALLTALALPVVLALAGAAIDFSRYHAGRAKLQEFADTLALRGAKELSLVSMSDRSIVGAVNAAADAISQSLGLGEPQLTVSVNRDAASVTVSLSQPAPRMLLLASFSPYDARTLRVSAEAVVRGGQNVCVVALKSDGDAINASDAANLSAHSCALLSNSVARSSIVVKDKALLEASLICSSGGFEGSPGGFSPRAPLTDCPPYEDPLANRSPPQVGPCAFNNVEVGFLNAAKSMGTERLITTRLTPGVYCGGLKIRDLAHVEFDPGIYVVKDGPLLVCKNSDLVGRDVGFYLTGDAATFLFDKHATVSLTAPKDGPMAGILFFEDRGAPADRNHVILSEDARTLLGTFYLPRGNLVIDTQNPVADQSAYTAIIARRLELKGKPTLMINADYSATDVPVPSGLGPVGADIYLRE